MKKLLVNIFLIGTFVGAAAMAWAIVAFKGNAVREDVSLYVEPESDYAALKESLLPHIKHHTAFSIYSSHLDLEQTFKAGHYYIQRGESIIEIVRRLKLGMQTPVRVTFNNVRTVGQLSARLSEQLAADTLQFAEALSSETLAREVGYDSLTLFSMFIPDTYELYWTISPEDFVRRMKRESERFWTGVRDEQCKAVGLSRLEVMTLASIVYEETAKTDEMPRIAGVYMNRLKKGMPLQADPTIKYALQDFTLRRILHKHLRYKSPYNTYLNKGLPPSPIAMPSKAAIDAVLRYERHNYLYFCARPTFDGYHDFATTYSDHLRNARAYAAALDRRNIK